MDRSYLNEFPGLFGPNPSDQSQMPFPGVPSIPVAAPNPFEPSITNPRNRNDNCASVAAARHEHYDTADEFYKSVYSRGPPRGGLTSRQFSNMLARTEQPYDVKTFTESHNSTAFGNLQRAHLPTSGSGLVTYFRPDGSGHAVNAYFQPGGLPRFVDYQHSDFGDNCQWDVQNANKIMNRQQV